LFAYLFILKDALLNSSAFNLFIWYLFIYSFWHSWHVELWGLHLLGKYSTTWSIPPALSDFSYYSDRAFLSRPVQTMILPISASQVTWTTLPSCLIQNFWGRFSFLWDWDLISGLCICKAGTLLLEPHL
jgi:hypothetical protein